MVQTGDPTNTGKGGESIWGGKFQDEIKDDLKHKTRGVLSMANSGPNSNGSQWFLTYAPQPSLDLKYTVFGKVIDGWDTLDELERIPVNPKNHRPLKGVEATINAVTGRSPGLFFTAGSTRRVLRRMLPRRGLAVPRSSSVPLLELPCRTSWQRGTRSLRCEKPRGSRQFAPPRIRRKPPSKSLLSRTRLRRRHTRQQRMSRRPAPAGSVARDKYFAFKFLWQFVQ